MNTLIIEDFPEPVEPTKAMVSPLLTEKDMAAILLSDQGLRKDVGDRRYIAVLNQCDDSTVRKSAEQIGEMLINSTRQNSETIEEIVFAKLQ